jgi:hypothetical protein
MIALLVVLAFLLFAGIALLVVSRKIWDDSDTRPNRLY